MKTVSAFVRLDRPSTAAMPVPVPHHKKGNQEKPYLKKKSHVARTDVSQEDQERQHDHDEVAVPDDETAVELKTDKNARHKSATPI